jgi:hypothetical protein|tara:strand:+ start:11297 stop:12331 length:1035 start_codon:yes stop_codon:yes gene_type:complete
MMAFSEVQQYNISGKNIENNANTNFNTSSFFTGALITIVNSSSNTGTYVIDSVSGDIITVTQELVTETVSNGSVVTNVLFNTDSITAVSQIPQTKGMSYHVFLDLGARADDDLGAQSPITNRIGLLAETFGVQTTKQRPTFPVPGTALVTGESKTLSIDLAAATKTFNMGGIITEQLLVKKFPTGGRMDETNPLSTDGYPGKDGSEVARVLTAQEVAQFLHSALDSSFLQPYQNITNMAVLVPSRVGYDYNYHSGVNENTPVEYLPLIPFSFKSRFQDNLRSVTLDNSAYFTPSHSSTIQTHPVVIQNITTDFVPGQPWLTFSIQGEFIFDVLGSAKDVFGEDS